MNKINVLILSKGYISTKIYNKLNKKYNLFRLSKSELDYTDGENLEFYIADNNIEFVINCYGYTGSPNVDTCELEKKQCYQRNVIDNLKILKALTILDIPFIHIDSGCVYSDEDAGVYFTENDPANFGFLNPTSSYYSKCKDLFQTLANELQYTQNGYIFRIRMPYDEYIYDQKNYLYKLLHYNKLVSYYNSLTNINVLIDIIDKTIGSNISFGIYNIVDSGVFNALYILSLLYENEIKNTNFKSIPEIEDNLYTVDSLLSEGIIKARRSNCILSNEKISKELDIKIPSSHLLIDHLIKEHI